MKDIQVETLQPFMLFPITVQQFKAHIDDEMRDAMRNRIMDMYKAHDVDEPFQTNDLSEDPTFDVLKAIAIKCAEHYCQEFQYDYQEVYLQTIWANVMKKGEDFPTHTHGNSFLSGVYYLDAQGDQSIIFHDPSKNLKTVFRPDVKNMNAYNAYNAEISPYADMILLFPSWLAHHVDKLKSDATRISIAFNVSLRGRGNMHKQWYSTSPYDS
jgi:uncharacterized protein (TIGR02466 family)